MKSVVSLWSGIQYSCAKYGSDQIRCNGHSQGHACYQCKACRYRARSVPATVAKVAQYGQVDALLVERNSLRSIVRATGVSCMSIAKRIRKKRRPVAHRYRIRARKQRWEVLELDEMGSFVGRKVRKVWLCSAVERVIRRIVVWTLGSRGEASARRLWAALPPRYRWHFTDEWKAYAKVLPRYQQRPCPKGGSRTRIVEVINCSLRQCMGVLVKSCSFSKCLKIHTARSKISIDNHNRSIILN